MEYRFRVHKIEIIKDYRNFIEKGEMERARNLTVGTIMNIMDNSIWWMGYGDVKNKKIFVSISEEISGYLSIVIADNGPGFALPVGEIIKPWLMLKISAMQPVLQ